LEAERVTVGDLLAGQTLVTDPYALMALRRAVLADGLTAPAAQSVQGD
jgi:hypothetical protein